MTGPVERICPICGGGLLPLGPRYSIDQLLELWRPVTFSAAIRDEHAAQSAFTQLHRCPDCRLGIFLPRIIGTARFYSEAYNLEGTQSESAFTYSAEKWDFFEGLRDVRPGDSVLEIGAGVGHFLIIARERGCSVVGVEFNEIAAVTARARGLTVHRSLEPLLRSGEKFDRIFAFHVLEHVADPIGFLTDLQRLARPEGRIGIAVPNQDGPIRLIEPCVQDMPPHHATRWSYTTFERAAEKVKLEIDRAAREPLTPGNLYYYSEYAPRRLLTDRTCLGAAAIRLGSMVIGRVLRGYLGLLRGFGRTSSKLLPGQAIYVQLALRPAR